MTTWDVVLFRQIFTSRGLAKAYNQITGRSPQQDAEILVDRLDLAEQPEIEITPSWWPWMPWLKTRISIDDLHGGS